MKDKIVCVEWDGKEDFVDYLRMALPVMWGLYARIN